MTKQTKKILGTVASTILLLFMQISCETLRNDCGNIQIENEIDELSMRVGEIYYRDLFAEPVVLSHTRDENIVILVEGGDAIANAYRARSNITGNLNAIEIEAVETGTTSITIIATDKCNEVYIDLNVTIIE